MVIALDGNGYATSEKVNTSGDGAAEPLVIELDPESIYYVVTR